MAITDGVGMVISQRAVRVSSWGTIGCWMTDNLWEKMKSIWQKYWFSLDTFTSLGISVIFSIETLLIIHSMFQHPTQVPIYEAYSVAAEAAVNTAEESNTSGPGSYAVPTSVFTASSFDMNQPQLNELPTAFFCRFSPTLNVFIVFPHWPKKWHLNTLGIFTLINVKLLGPRAEDQWLDPWALQSAASWGILGLNCPKRHIHWSVSVHIHELLLLLMTQCHLRCYSLPPVYQFVCKLVNVMTVVKCTDVSGDFKSAI